jgi:hypothetical protein
MNIMPMFCELACHHVASAAQHELQLNSHIMRLFIFVSLLCIVIVVLVVAITVPPPCILPPPPSVLIALAPGRLTVLGINEATIITFPP